MNLNGKDSDCKDFVKIDAVILTVTETQPYDRTTLLFLVTFSLMTNGKCQAQKGQNVRGFPQDTTN